MKKSYFFLGLSVLWLNQSAFSKSDLFLRANSSTEKTEISSKSKRNNPDAKAQWAEIISFEEPKQNLAPLVSCIAPPKPTITATDKSESNNLVSSLGLISSDSTYTICNSGGFITLESSVAPNGGTYLWSNNATTQSITVTDSGQYSVRVIDNGCTSAVSRTFKVGISECVNFLGTVNNDLTNPANWPGNTLPSPSANVVFPGNTNLSIPNNGTFTCHNLYLIKRSTITGGTSSSLFITEHLIINGSILGPLVTSMKGTRQQIIVSAIVEQAIAPVNSVNTASPRGDNGLTEIPIQTISNLEIANDSSYVALFQGTILEITNSLRLKKGALLVPASGNFSSITFKSDANGTAYIDDFSPGFTGALLSLDSGIIFERYTPAGYRHLSVPTLSTLHKMDDFGANCNSIKVFDEASNIWVPAPSNCNTQTAIAFINANNNPIIYSPTPTTLKFNGSFFNFKLSGGSNILNIKRTASVPNGPARGWNSMGNFFAAPINWNVLKNLNGNNTKTNGALWVWNSQLNKWATYTSAGVATNGGSPIIAIGQGFMVRALNNGASTLAVDTSIFIAQNTSQFLRSGSTNENEIIRFNLNGTKGSDEAVIHLTPFANALEDDNDAERPMSLGGGDSPELSTIAPNGTKMMINALSHAELSEKELPLSLNVTEAGDYNLVMTENLSDFNVSIFDLKTGVAVPAESGLKISAIEKGEIAGRYFVRVSAKSNTETVNSTFTAWSVGNQEVKVRLADATNANLEVVNALGQSINFAQEKTSSNEVSLKFSTPQTGILFVRQGGKTEKISIR